MMFPCSEAYVAMDRFLQFYPNKTPAEFWDFLGISLFKAYYINVDALDLTLEEAHKVTLLTGPHWYTVLKAYEAQQCQDQ